jgi:hypothetical protein
VKTSRIADEDSVSKEIKYKKIHLIQTLGNVARVKKSAQNHSPSARDFARIS